MKRVILLSGILIMFFSASDMFAQRGGRGNDRNRKEEVRRNDRRGNDRDFRKDKYGRSVRVVDARVYRDNGRRGNGNFRPDARNSRVYYDYDFRRGRRIAVNRGYRPSARHIWVSGYWQFNPRLRREVWVDGHWSLRRSNHRWVAGHYSAFNGVRIWVDGCWTVF